MVNWKGLIFNDVPEEAPAGPTLVAVNRAAFSAPLSANQGMVDQIYEAIMKRKTPYTALKEASDRMASAIPEGITRLKAAYAMVGGDSRTIDQISKAIDLHISDVAGEEARFLQATKQKRDSDVGTLQAKADSLRKSNEDLSREATDLQTRLQQLQSTMNDNTAQIQAATTEANAKDTEIADVEKQYKSAAQRVRDELEQQRKTILSTLK